MIDMHINVRILQKQERERKKKKDFFSFFKINKEIKISGAYYCCIIEKYHENTLLINK